MENKSVVDRLEEIGDSLTPAIINTMDADELDRLWFFVFHLLAVLRPQEGEDDVSGLYSFASKWHRSLHSAVHGEEKETLDAILKPIGAMLHISTALFAFWGGLACHSASLLLPKKDSLDEGALQRSHEDVARLEYVCSLMAGLDEACQGLKARTELIKENLVMEMDAIRKACGMNLH